VNDRNALSWREGIFHGGFLMKKAIGMALFVYFLCAMGPAHCSSSSAPPDGYRRNLEVTWRGGDSSVEIGSPWCGMEFHHGVVEPSRISFFYPLANSIDASRDYWERDTSRVLHLGIRVGEGKRESMDSRPFSYELTPFSVRFHRCDEDKEITIAYQFCKNSPALVARYEVINRGRAPRSIELFTDLNAELRTCASYTRKIHPDIQAEGKRATFFTYNDADTGKAQLFITDAGETPGASCGSGECGTWRKALATPVEAQSPGSASLYRRSLEPGERMTIIQIIGSCRSGEGREIAARLRKTHEKEVLAYEASIYEKVFDTMVMETGDPWLDHSIRWAKAILAVNAHYLDGVMVPMPCPAEYNFFFTHDALLTDLAAVYIDCDRVRRDLLYIQSHASPEGIIPHAYYWKDDHYITERAGPDNWNNLWFILVTARYLRHSHDTGTVVALLPLLDKSIQAVLRTQGDLGLMEASRPDWWDIGTRPGPRAYMSILTIRALREYGYIAASLGMHGLALSHEKRADQIEKALHEILWDEDAGYLLNRFRDGTVDRHRYSGSLLAVHFNLLGGEKKARLLEEAERVLLDRRLGIYNVWPMDFHRLGEFFTFSGPEAGEPFYYMNGGIWPHGNAWYALGLMETGRKAQALEFMRSVMTLEGVMESPHGQPAMYEYRVGAKDPALYGKIDKPQFLWAAGWYIYCWQHLFGAGESPWNTRFDPYVPPGGKMTRGALMISGRPLLVEVRGQGRVIRSIAYDEKVCPSAVIPEPAPGAKKVLIILGKPLSPYIASLDSILLDAQWKDRTLKATLKAFAGHRDELTVISPWKPKSVEMNQKSSRQYRLSSEEGVFTVTFPFIHEAPRSEILMHF
jgi:hypothetical protein